MWHVAVAIPQFPECTAKATAELGTSDAFTALSASSSWSLISMAAASCPDWPCSLGFGVCAFVATWLRLAGRLPCSAAASNGRLPPSKSLVIILMLSSFFSCKVGFPFFPPVLAVLSSPSSRETFLLEDDHPSRRFSSPLLHYSLIECQLWHFPLSSFPRLVLGIVKCHWRTLKSTQVCLFWLLRRRLLLTISTKSLFVFQTCSRLYLHI